MSISERLERLPIEDWAAVCAGGLRRWRRRIARRPGAAAVVLFSAVAVVVTGSNALWRQDARHPAPFWGERDNAAATFVGSEPDSAPGGRSDLVVRIQEALYAEGFYDGDATGVLDEQTGAAIRKFEAAEGLPLSGQPSLGLLAVLEPSQGDTAEEVVEETRSAAVDAGSHATVDVAAVQRMLNERGYGPLTVDGVMGPRTRAALAAYAGTPQGRNDMTPALLTLVEGGV